MATTTRVAAWQCLPGPRDVAGNLRRLDAIGAAAAARGVEVLVTPEMFTSGYAITRADAERLAEDAGGPTEAAVAEIARRHHLAIVFGHPERAPEGHAYNAATMIGPDGVVRGRHRKVHLYGDLDREQFAASGARPAAFDFAGSRAGVLICYDVEFPEAVRSLAIDGARAVYVPTANMIGCEEVQEILVRARACENNCRARLRELLRRGRGVRVQRAQPDLRAARRGARPGRRQVGGTDHRGPARRVHRHLPGGPPGGPVRPVRQVSAGFATG